MTSLLAAGSAGLVATGVEDAAGIMDQSPSSPSSTAATATADVKRFQRHLEDFECGHCGHIEEGNGYTNHCSACLWSKHVDINPGDRAAACQGLMQPIGVDTKKGLNRILQRCELCGHERWNKQQEQDDFEAILKVVAEQGQEQEDQQADRGHGGRAKGGRRGKGSKGGAVGSKGRGGDGGKGGKGGGGREGKGKGKGKGKKRR